MACLRVSKDAPKSATTASTFHRISGALVLSYLRPKKTATPNIPTSITYSTLSNGKMTTESQSDHLGHKSIGSPPMVKGIKILARLSESGRRASGGRGAVLNFIKEVLTNERDHNTAQSTALKARPSGTAIYRLYGSPVGHLPCRRVPDCMSEAPTCW